jgi:hypothetical protein
MKKVALFAILIFSIFGFTSKSELKVTVRNTLSINRINETVEVAISDITIALGNVDFTRLVVFDDKAVEIPSQLIYLGEKTPSKLIFQASVNGMNSSTYFIKIGNPSKYLQKAFSRFVPERFDDYAWENDRIAHRIYATALIAKDGPSNGLDVWVKRTDNLIIDKWYSDYTVKKISYHKDWGDGCDCYKVGRTLGAGAMAPYVNDSLWLGMNFQSYAPLDNGPIRTSFKLIYPPFSVNGKMVTETRTFSLDAGSQLSSVMEEYSGYEASMPVVAGIVKTKEGKITDKSLEKGYVSYSSECSEGGTIYVGVISSTPVSQIFEKNNHVLLKIIYNPSNKLLYFAGAGWSKWGFETADKWNLYIDEFSSKIQHPLIVELK